MILAGRVENVGVAEVTNAILVGCFERKEPFEDLGEDVIIV
jgi:hypothetical protein